jgi:hypothetical protein
VCGKLFLVKRCRRCERELDEGRFHRHAIAADGLRNQCKDCVRIYSRAYYAGHRDEQIAKARAWQKDNPEKTLENQRRVRQSERAVSYMAEYHRTHKSERRDRDAKKRRTCKYCGAEMEHRAWLDHRVVCPDRPLSRHAIYRKGHPLGRGRHGKVATHRFVLYESIGAGPHECYWCGEEVEWTMGGAGPGCPRGALAVDHVDGDRHNNELANLVPACNACNTLRGLIQGWEDRTGLDIAGLF